jgi:acetoin utilization deacetylase AcuC-like enzyme
MKVVFHEDFKQRYSEDPAAVAGRVEAIMDVIQDRVTFVKAIPASEEDIAAVHTPYHIEAVRSMDVYDIAALAAGGAIQAATIGLEEPCFALIRPPGHHASANSAWGFCFFNNMAIALSKLRREEKIRKAYVLDFDLHFGDGNVSILGGSGYVTIFNPSTSDREEFLKMVDLNLPTEGVDIIGVSAGFDYAVDDWGGVLEESDYTKMGRMIREAARKCGAGCFAILEGGYNHQVLGYNCMAFLEGLGA